MVQLIPSSGAVVRQELNIGGQVSEEGAFSRANSTIVLRRGLDVLSQITTIPDAEFVQHKSDSSWEAHGESPIFLLVRKDKLPLIVFVQYANSNGSYFRIYIIQQLKDKFEITPIEYSDSNDHYQKNALFGDTIRMFYDEIKKQDLLCIYGYDNSIGNNFTIYYMAGNHDEAQWELVEYRTGSERTDCLDAER